MKITIVLRSPFLDRIPSLKNLIIFLANKGIKIKVISCVHHRFPQANFDNNNIIKINSKERQKKWGIPTSIKLFGNLIKDIIFDRSNIYIGGDELGCKIILKIKKIFHINYWNFLLEYPNINDYSSIETLLKANVIITHDRWHSDFINKSCGTHNSQFLYLPNATFTNECHNKTTYLADKIGLKSDEIILLHSGGLGKWFLCKELAEASKKLLSGNTIVFHTSHNVTGSEYFKEISDLVEEHHLPVKFSLFPVSNEELDILVASATIGLAFYSVKDLGYRAENMGVAAGKIGNYLKCGVPVICTKVHSLSYIEEYKCGVLINSFDELPKAVNTILESIDIYRQNAYRCYRELWNPTPYLQNIYSYLNK